MIETLEDHIDEFYPMMNNDRQTYNVKYGPTFYLNGVTRVCIRQITRTKWETLVFCMERIEHTDLVTGEATHICHPKDLFIKPLDTPAAKVLFGEKGRNFE
jgi:hypothetical protein